VKEKRGNLLRVSVHEYRVADGQGARTKIDSWRHRSKVPTHGANEACVGTNGRFRFTGRSKILDFPTARDEHGPLKFLDLSIVRKVTTGKYKVRHYRQNAAVLTKTEGVRKWQETGENCMTSTELFAKILQVGPVLRRSILRLFTLTTVSKYYLKY
jgi:hypothetical protein